MKDSDSSDSESVQLPEDWKSIEAPFEDAKGQSGLVIHQPQVLDRESRS
jgi:hypothetical protein